MTRNTMIARQVPSNTSGVLALLVAQPALSACCTRTSTPTI